MKQINAERFQQEYEKEPRRPTTLSGLRNALKRVLTTAPTNGENRTPTQDELTQRYRLDRR